jgi:arylsulfatase I/J
MYGMEMAKLVHKHAARTDADATPFFLYMAFQNNHAPYTKVPVYDARFPEIQAGSMKQVYNGNMAAVDDAIGSLMGALDANTATFGGKTVIVFSQDNGGPAKDANNLPLRGAKFGIFEGGVRSFSFVWGPGVLPSNRDARAGRGPRMYLGIVHLADWWVTFAGLAGVNATDAGPTGFERPDGVDQWPALVEAAAGHAVAPADQPRTEVVIDLNPAYNKGGSIVALRVGDFKIM